MCVYKLIKPITLEYRFYTVCVRKDFTSLNSSKNYRDSYAPKIIGDLILHNIYMAEKRLAFFIIFSRQPQLNT